MLGARRPGYRAVVLILRLVGVSLLVTGGVAFGACNSDEVPAAGGHADEREVLDWERGTYEDVRLGDSTARLVRVLGPPEERGRNEPAEPIGENFYDIGGMTNYASPEIAAAGAYEVLRYRRRVFNVEGDRVTSWGTTDDRAQTPEGVGVGDSQDLVERRYPNANCFIQNEGTEYTTYPICKIRVCAGRLLGFGGDPIKSIWLAAETKTGLKSCRHQR
jgi:hypothetical protein